MQKLKKWFSIIQTPIFLIFCSLFIYLAVWYLALIGSPRYHFWSLKNLSSTLGVAGYYLFACSLALSTRWKKEEAWFGGLDQIYHLHRKLGIWGFCFIFLHPWVEALKWLPNHINKFLLMTLPVHNRLSVNLGAYAFWLMLVILGVTVLKLKEKPLNFIPGQYGFFVFHNPKLSRESHPFTLIKSVEGLTVSILVKARGDYTINFYKNIKKGDLCTLEGPYGCLNYTQAGGSQIWIAGGVGVVLFLAWIRAIKCNLPKEITVDFHYCIHKKADVLFYNEFIELNKACPNFRCFLYCSEEGNRFDIDKMMSVSNDIRNKKIFICGPLKLTHYLKNELPTHGLSAHSLFVEEFEFQT